MVTLMAAADLIVSMAGYNTICEILSLRRKAIVIPRVTPTEEQLLRVERIASCGCFTAIHPDDLTPELMSGEIWRAAELSSRRGSLDSGRSRGADGDQCRGGGAALANHE
jgi:predicted glycosyltransferase